MGELPAYDLATDELRIALSYAQSGVTTDLPKYTAPTPGAAKKAAKKVGLLLVRYGVHLLSSLFDR